MNKFMILFSHRKKGQSMVEFAAGITVLLVLVAGLVDVGRAIFTFITMRDAAEESAAFGSVYPTHCMQMEDRALSNLQDPGSYDITIMIDSADCYHATSSQACLGHNLTVTVSNPAFDLSMPLIGTFLGRQSISLSATVTNTIIRTPCH
jgi:hypothetical protein